MVEPFDLSNLQNNFKISNSEQPDNRIDEGPAVKKSRRSRIKVKAGTDLSYIPHPGQIPHPRSRAILNHQHTSISELPQAMEKLEKMENRSSLTIQGQRGERLEDRFVVDRKEIAQEVALRTNVLSTLKQSLTDRLSYLESLSDAELPSSEREQLIEICTRNLDQVNRCLIRGQTWAGSGSYRRLLENMGTTQAKTAYIPALVNLRSQSVEVEGNTKSILNRSGAISDYRNGNTNLLELKDLQSSLAEASSVSDLSKIQIRVLRRAIPELDKFSATKTKGVTITQIKNLVDRAIIDRQFVLENQALQDIVQHVANIQASGHNLAETLASKENFSIGRVSMLDGVKPPKNDGGFALNEANQMQDMVAIYDLLDGKTLVFDGKGPFLDEEGDIHMPFEVTDHEGAPVSKELHTIYFNISAQGNVKNEGIQEQINRKAIQQLQSEVKKQCFQLINEGRLEESNLLASQFTKLHHALILETVTDGFSVAEDTAMLLMEIDVSLSINCFSGKDRTGLLAALITFNALKEELIKLELEPEKHSRVLANWGRQLMSDGHIAPGVVKDCTGFSALKLSVLQISLLFQNRSASDCALGAFKRIEGLGKALGTFALDPGATGEGQLWE